MNIAQIKQRAGRFKEVSSHPRLKGLNEVHKLFILQVYSGLKRAGTFDGLGRTEKKTMGRILSLMDALDIAYQVKDSGNNVKIFFSKDRRTADDLSLLYPKVFKENSHHLSYGLLLGYPACCIRSYLSKGRGRWLLGHLTFVFKRHIRDRKIRLPFQLNMVADLPLIWHWSCGAGCRETNRLADRILKLYESYDRALAQGVLRSLKKPVLLFQNDSYVRFEGSLRRNVLAYERVQYINPYLAEEGLSQAPYRFTDVLGKLIARGDTLLLEGDSFQLGRRKKILFRHDAAKEDFLLLCFH